MREITAKEARERAKGHDNDTYFDCRITNLCLEIRNVAIKGGHSVLYSRSQREGSNERLLAKLEELGYAVSEANGKFLIEW